jgi:hypothetical protein
MGVYPHYSKSAESLTPDGLTAWTETREEPGVIYQRKVMATGWTEVARTDCFCCTCWDYSVDPVCRNHGFDGQRPCEAHNMPGTPSESGVMPDSVQVFRAMKADAAATREV